jgi:adenosylmethionine-8-amino-7-oxononanoate aminotransferase
MTDLGAPENTPDDWELDRRHVLHPFQHFESFEKEGALVITGGEGCYLTDAGGKRYFDAVGGLWCTNIGLGNQEMADAIATQVLELGYANPFVDMTNAPAARLAARLASLAPGDLNHVFFSNGGSMANEAAFRIVQMYHASRGKAEKTIILSRKDSYHGSTYLTGSLSGKPGDRVGEFGYLTDVVHHLSSPDSYRLPEGKSEADFCDELVDEMERTIFELGPDRVGAFIAEPLLGSGGVIVPPADYNRRTWELCRKHDVLYIADEVVTAFGRLGHWFASESVFGIQPDIISCAKGLTSGYLPLGATLYSDEIHRVIADDPDRFFATGYTYSGHPVCCAAALKNLEILEREQLFDNVLSVGPYFEESLGTLLDLPIVGAVRGSHFMMCVVNVRDKTTKEGFGVDVNIGKRISNHAEDLGLMVRPIGDLNVMSPPLTMTRDDVDFVVGALRRAIERTMEDLRREGIWHG